jgi:hypothetical protein
MRINKLNSKSFFGTIILIILAISVSVLFSRRKKVTFIGFAYLKDSITISYNGNIITNINRPCNSYNADLCQFYSEQKAFYLFSDIRINVKIDSANVSVMDTSVLLTKNVRNFGISFKDPHETPSHRELFTFDENDGQHDKY